MTAGRRLDVFVTAEAFSRSLPEALDLAARAGWDCVELGSGLAHHADWREALKAHPEMRFAIHNYFPAPADAFVVNLASADAALRRRSIDHARRGIDISAELGARFYSVHPGFGAAVRAEDLGRPLGVAESSDRRSALARLQESVKALLDHRGALDLVVAIENNVVAGFNRSRATTEALLFAEPEEIVALVRDIDAPRFGCLLDLGHAHVTARTFERDAVRMVTNLLPVTVGLHLSDNDGQRDSNRPFDCDAWFWPALSGFAGSFASIEVYGASAAELETCRRATLELARGR